MRNNRYKVIFKCQNLSFECSKEEAFAYVNNFGKVLVLEVSCALPIKTKHFIKSFEKIKNANLSFEVKYLNKTKHFDNFMKATTFSDVLQKANIETEIWVSYTKSFNKINNIERAVENFKKSANKAVGKCMIKSF